ARRSPTRGSGESVAWRIAETLVRGREPGDLNQAVMELGATVCTPRSPDCPSCPVAGNCDARRLGVQDDLPRRRAPARAADVRVEAAWIERRGNVLLARKRAGGPLRGEWDVPCVEVRAGDEPGRALARTFARRFGLRIRLGEGTFVVKHAILG